jgi:hypothetical protein
LLKNRAFLVKMVKDEDAHVNGVDSTDYHQLGKMVTKSAVIIIGVYMGADTLRQVLVHIAKTGIQSE